MSGTTLLTSRVHTAALKRRPLVKVFSRKKGKFENRTHDQLLIALSHIHVSAAHRWRIYENVETPGSEAYFVQARYVSCSCYVPVAYQ